MPAPVAAPATRSFRAKHEAVYASERDCVRYDEALCRRQDFAGRLEEAIMEVAVPLSKPPELLRIADVGAGTGKLARLLAPRAMTMAVVDRSTEALAVARASLIHSEGRCALSFHESDLRTLPLESSAYDVVVVGWALSYLKSEYEEWHADGSSGGPWREEVDAALAELDRVLVPGGTLVVLETQGTATATPQRAGSWLYAHYRDAGFEERSVRTDYRFPSKAVAMDTLRFFFGKGVAVRAGALLASVPDEGEACDVPECTGMWWRRKATVTDVAPQADVVCDCESTDT